MSSELFLEALEPRIAPASIINVGNPDPSSDPYPGNITFNDAPFKVANSNSTDPGIAALFSTNEAGHYYLVLNSGDKVNLYNSSGSYKDYITVTGGKAIAYFHDVDGDGNVDSDDLTGFSVAASTGLAVVGSVDGDIIGNLDAKTGLINLNSLLNDATSINKLNIQGSLGNHGSVIAGGKISNITIAGAANEISTGSDGTYSYHFGGSTAAAGVGEAALFAFTPTKTAGAIVGVTVGQVDTIQGGVGGAGAVGGAVTNVKIVSDSDGFSIFGGAGGIGTKGGAGGAVSSVVVYGVPDETGDPTANSPIIIAGGAGADPLNLATGSGGAGGAVSKIYVGYQYLGNDIVQSEHLLRDNVDIGSGDGGAGKTGGNAGAISAINIATLTPFLTGDEIDIHGGNGGDGSTKNGAGGSITDVTASNFNDISTTDGMHITGGSGGVGAGDGGNGGSLSKLSLFADHLELTGGAGTDGLKKGGIGGSISGITLVYLSTDHIQNIIFTAGDGGNAVSGAAGNGGSISTISGAFTDLRGLVNSLHSGTGGDAAIGKGGAGGNIQNVSLFEPALTVFDAQIFITAGGGGDGTTQGGAGGALKSVSFFGSETLATAVAGDGGNATLKGAGGAGGGIDSLAIQALLVNPVLGSLAVTAGNGGFATGASKGGAGGSITNSNIFSNIDVSITGGEGGVGDLGTSGAGGSLSGLAGISTAGNVNLVGGNAHASGTEKSGGAGGSLTSVVAVAFDDIVVQAGDGQMGGAGGSIKTVAWYGISGSIPDSGVAPTGAIDITGGQGSVGLKTAGVGGSITSATGFASSTGVNLTTITAGDGNGGIMGAKAAAGGSVSSVTLRASDSSSGEVNITAGAGGSLNIAGAAGVGGSVTGVSAAENVDLHAVAAGDGGDSVLGTGKGGVGGSITKLNIFGDIGTRAGLAFGIDGMGGIFAGTGGTGGTTALDGKAGNVTSVTADAIASIVAGRPTVANPQDFELVNLVDQISLRGLVAPTVNVMGGFTNFFTANVVGGIAGTPTANGANVFKIDVGGSSTPIPANPYNWNLGTMKPLDGLVAAVTFGSANKDYRPQALLLPDGSGGYSLLDYRNDFNTNS